MFLMEKGYKRMDDRAKGRKRKPLDYTEESSLKEKERQPSESRKKQIRRGSPERRRKGRGLFQQGGDHDIHEDPGEAIRLAGFIVLNLESHQGMELRPWTSVFIYPSCFVIMVIKILIRKS